MQLCHLGRSCSIKWTNYNGDLIAVSSLRQGNKMFADAIRMHKHTSQVAVD
jgi:hypothetical protein